MDPITPSNANYSNYDGTETHEGGETPSTDGGATQAGVVDFLFDYAAGKALDWAIDKGIDFAKDVAQTASDLWEDAKTDAENCGRGVSEPNGYSPFGY